MAVTKTNPASTTQVKKRSFTSRFRDATVTPSSTGTAIRTHTGGGQEVEKPSKFSITDAVKFLAKEAVGKNPKS